MSWAGAFGVEVRQSLCHLPEFKCFGVDSAKSGSLAGVAGIFWLWASDLKVVMVFSC